MMMTEMTDLVLIDSERVVNGTMAALKGFSNKAGIAISSAIVSFTLAATDILQMPSDRSHRRLLQESRLQDLWFRLFVEL